MNAIEANASRVEFGIEWQAVEKLKTYRRTIIDNGIGMDAQELESFFLSYGVGSDNTSGLHTNFGIGGKVSTIPWNPNGVVIISYKNRVPSMIWIHEEDETFCPFPFHLEGETKVVINPVEDIDWDEWHDYLDVNWGQVAPKWIKEHGTMIVLLGSKDHVHTVKGDPKNSREKSIKGLSKYLNTRFWDLSDFEVKVAELNHENKNEWPRNSEEQKGKINNRKIEGAKYYLNYNFKNKEKAKKGFLDAKGSISLFDGKLEVEWFLWNGERPEISDSAQKNGFIGIRLKDELFEVNNNIRRFRHFGIYNNEVKEKVTIILKPILKGDSKDDPIWGVHQSNDRNLLYFSSSEEKSVPIPYAEWGEGFSEKLPPEILNAIEAIKHDMSGTLDDSFKDRLPKLFAGRWRSSVAVNTSYNDSEGKISELIRGGKGEMRECIEKHSTDEINKPRTIAPRPTPKDLDENYSNSDKPKQKKVNQGFPKFDFLPKEDFQNEWHMGMWAPNKNPPTVYINKDSEVLKDAVRYHQDRNKPELAEQVSEIVHQVFGEIAVSKMAHLQELSKSNKLPTEQLNESYRSEEAITTALMGIFAEEFAIEARLKKILGAKKK